MSLKKSKGSALMLVIVVMAFLTITGAALLAVSSSEINFTKRQENRTQSHYLGRSGVNAGLQMLEEKIYQGTYSSIDTLCSALNSAANGGADISLPGTGSFRLSFIKQNANEIKIQSIGKDQGTPQVTDTVTLTAHVVLPDTSKTSTNPSDWLTANGGSLDNPQSEKVLSHNVTTLNNYIGKMIILNGGVKVTKYPQGGGSDAASTFQASIIVLKTDTDGIPCLNQDSNNLDVTFDAEIIFFGDGIQYRNKDIVISASNAVLTRPDDGIIQPATQKGYGFENLDRYCAFVQQYYPSLTKDYLKNTFWSGYGFNSSYKYGIVCFKKNISSGIQSNYYFFPSNDTNGTSIIHHNDIGSTLGYDRLIPINPNDPIKNILDSMYSSSGTIQAEYWNNN